MLLLQLAYTLSRLPCAVLDSYIGSGPGLIPTRHLKCSRYKNQMVPYASGFMFVVPGNPSGTVHLPVDTILQFLVLFQNPFVHSQLVGSRFRWTWSYSLRIAKVNE